MIVVTGSNGFIGSNLIKGLNKIGYKDIIAVDDHNNSELKENIIQTLGNIPKINLHLGLTPYFRGSGCNFWPLYLNKPEFIGASIIELDSGIDTGNLIHQFNEVFTSTDTVHTIGNRVY